MILWIRDIGGRPGARVGVGPAGPGQIDLMIAVDFTNPVTLTVQLSEDDARALVRALREHT